MKPVPYRGNWLSQRRFGYHRCAGFTLIELIATIVVLGIMAVVGTSVIADSFILTTQINRRQVVYSEARYAMERMAREIREIQYNGTSYVTSNMGAANFVFTKSDATIVTLNNSGANLTIAYSTVAGVTATLSDKVDTSGFALTYLDVSGGTATATSLRFVQVALTLKDRATGYSTTLRTRIGVRNS